MRDEIQRRFVPFDERATTQIQEVTDLDVEGEEPSKEEMDQAKQDIYEFYQERLKSNIESDSSARTAETDHDAGQSQRGGTSAQKPTSKPPKAGGTYAARPNSRPPQQGTVASRPNSKGPANRQEAA